jgi:hypothetical protein
MMSQSQWERGAEIFHWKEVYEDFWENFFHVNSSVIAANNVKSVHSREKGVP